MLFNVITFIFFVSPGGEHPVGQLRGVKHKAGQDAAEAILGHEPGGQPGAVRLLGRQVPEASNVLPHLPRSTRGNPGPDSDPEKKVF